MSNMQTKTESYSRSRKVELPEKMSICCLILLQDILEQHYMIVVNVSINIGREKHSVAIAGTPLVDGSTHLHMVSIV